MKSVLKTKESQEGLVVSSSNLGKCSALEFHVTHPYSRVSVTYKSFSIRISRLVLALVLSVR